MREILFRGKRKDNGKWVHGTYLHLNAGRDYICGGAVWIGTLQPCKEEVIPETVGQFTGLTDKNGKKIFEGDILQTEDRIVVVVWHDASASWDSNFIRYVGEERWTGILNSQWGRWATIIGNIHDNPELLEGGAVDG